MGDYDLVLELSRRVSDAVPSCDQQAIRSKLGLSDIITHFIMLVSWLIVGDLTSCEVQDYSLA